MMRKMKVGWVVTCGCMLASMAVQADERRLPMPERFAKSVIVGKTIRNPFVGKLRLSQTKVDEFMLGKMQKASDAKLDVVVGPIVFYQAKSTRNRVLMDGRVRRPGDRFTLSDGSPARVLEVKLRSVVLEVVRDGRKESIERTQKSLKKRPA